MRDAIRKGTFSHGPSTALTFDAFANLYQQRYVTDKQLRSAETIDYRLRLLRRRFGSRKLSEISLGDIEDLRADLRTAGKKPATTNRYLALLRGMLNWAVLRGDLDETPFRKGLQAAVKLERENNRRDRRLSPEEEVKLLEASGGVLRSLVVAALETGMRRGELLSLRFSDVDLERNVIHIRAANAKSKKGRDVPVATTRLRTLLKFLSIDANGETKQPDASVFSNEVGEPIEDFRGPWTAALKRAEIRDLRFHDLRGEFASRLVEKGVPLSQVRDLLGHASIVTTERYDRQRFEALEGAVKRLDTGESFNFLSIGAVLKAPDTSSEDSTGEWKSMSVN
jgi:integrase